MSEEVIKSWRTIYAILEETGYVEMYQDEITTIVNFIKLHKVKRGGIMNNIYDNGALMLGRIDLVIKRVKKEIEDNLDMGFVDQEELLKDLEDLKSSDNDIVCINYDNGMGYTIDYWQENDIVKDSE